MKILIQFYVGSVLRAQVITEQGMYAEKLKAAYLNRTGGCSISQRADKEN